jgi:hypothetical protein
MLRQLRCLIRKPVNVAVYFHALDFLSSFLLVVLGDVDVNMSAGNLWNTDIIRENTYKTIY